MLRRIAESLGSTEAALRLAITLFTAYGLAAIHRAKISRQSPTIQYLYCVICGVSLLMFNHGLAVYHSIVGILLGYLLCKFLRGTVASVVIAWVFYMGYLLAGYYYTATDNYDILWTMPQCILTMRMIGLITDLYDGNRSKIPSESADTALKECPSLLEIAAFNYFYGSFIVGPQFSMTRFRNFITGKYEEPYVKGPLNPVPPSLQRLFLGIAYMVGHVGLTMILSTDYFLSEQFKTDYLIKKWILALLWFRIILLRYQAVWLITEGSCILSGLGYNGLNEKGQVLWDAVRNIRMVKFEFGSAFQSLVESFNYNTNQWAAKYVFKRLRFLGNKDASHVITLFFLAVWHGFYTGYIACFCFEYMCIIAERKVWSAFRRSNSFITFTRTPEILFPLWLIKKIIIVSGCTYGLIAFILLKFDRWFQVYKDLYFLGWILVVVSPFVLTYLVKSTLISSSKRRVKENHQG